MLQYLDRADFEQQMEDSYYDPEKRGTHIKYLKPGGNDLVLLCFDTKDIISI